MHVLISGSGIAGAALAWHLARLDIKVTILEKSKDMLAQGQNIDITGCAIQILRKMNLIDEVRKLNTTEKGTVFLDLSGKEIATFPVTSEGPSPTAEFEILRGDLALIFYDAVKDHANVEYMFDTSIEELVSNTDSGVEVRLTNGQRQKYDIAFAADGQWSKLRRSAFPESSITVVDKNAYCSYFTIPKQPGDTNWWYIYWGLKSRVASLRPDPHGTMRVCLTMMPLDKEEKELWELTARGSDRKSQSDLVKRHFADAGWQMERFLGALDQSKDFYLQGLQQIKMDKWWTGRVVCLGDAAHAPTPLTGMGTSLAIMGAHILAGEISKLQPGDDVQTAFKAYDDVYHRYTEKIQNIPSFVPGIAHPASKWHLWALQTGVSAASTIFNKLPLVAKVFGSRNQDTDRSGFQIPEYQKLNAEVMNVLKAGCIATTGDCTLILQATVDVMDLDRPIDSGIGQFRNETDVSKAFIVTLESWLGFRGCWKSTLSILR